MQAVATAVLRTPSRRGQTWQGRYHRGDAKAARSGMERDYLTSDPFVSLT